MKTFLTVRHGIAAFALLAFGVGSCSKQSAEPNPVVTAVAPAFADEGATVTLTGCNFSTTAEQNHITFNGLPASVISASAGELSVVVPAHAFDNAEVPAAEIFVAVAGRACPQPVLLKSLRYPAITSASPSSVRAGDVLTLRGRGFNTDLGQSTVLFEGADNGTLKATVRAATSTGLEVVIPAGAVSGSLTLLSYFNPAKTKYVSELFPITVTP